MFGDNKAAERGSSVASEGPPRAFAQFQHQKTNSSMKTDPNEAKSRLQAALWAEPVKWVSLGWV
jgi:hypothetical protein